MAIYKKFISLGIAVNNIPSILSRHSNLNAQRCAMINFRSIEKNLDLPPKPKRPLTPYIQFSLVHRPKLTAEHPDMSSTDQIKELAKQWRSIDDDEKEKYRVVYKEQLVDYTRKLMRYDQDLTPEQKELIKSERARQKSVTEKNKMKSRLKELGRPKKPPTPFVIYMVSRLNSRPKTTPLPVWLSSVGKEWRDLPANEKIAAQEESGKLMEQYQKDLVKWESQMIRMGHIDVLRSRRLLNMKGKVEPETPENSSQ